MCEKELKRRSCTECQQKLILYGSHAIAAFLRLLDDLWFADSLAHAIGEPQCCVCQQPPYELFCDASTMTHMLVVTVKATTLPMKDTLEALTRDLIAHGILDYEISMESLNKPVKPDPVTHARIR